MMTVPERVVKQAVGDGGVLQMHCGRCHSRKFNVFLTAEPLELIVVCAKCERPAKQLRTPLKTRP